MKENNNIPKLSDPGVFEVTNDSWLKKDQGYKGCEDLGYEIQGVNNTDELKFFKVKKFQWKSLKGRGAKSGIRVIYAYFPNEQKIIFIEIYFKASQENENRQRIIDFINTTKR